MKKMSLMVTSFLFFNLNGLSDGSQPFKDLTIGMKDVVCRDYKQTAYGLGHIGASFTVSPLLDCCSFKFAVVGASATWLASYLLKKDHVDYLEGYGHGLCVSLGAYLFGENLSVVKYPIKRSKTENIFLGSTVVLFPAYIGAIQIGEDLYMDLSKMPKKLI